MYRLYHYPHSQHGRRVVALLEATGIAYEVVPVAMDKGAHMAPEFLAINPNHQVPALADGPLVICESNAILRYLCHRHQLDDWYPVEASERALVEQWLDWNQCRLSSNVVDIVLNSVFMGDAGDKSAIERGKANLPEMLEILETGLDKRPFLAGQHPTIADLSVASNIFHLTFAGIHPDGPNTSRWYQAIGRIEGFSRSLPQGA